MSQKKSPAITEPVNFVQRVLFQLSKHTTEVTSAAVSDSMLEIARDMPEVRVSNLSKRGRFKSFKSSLIWLGLLETKSASAETYCSANFTNTAIEAAKRTTEDAMRQEYSLLVSASDAEIEAHPQYINGTNVTKLWSPTWLKQLDEQAKAIGRFQRRIEALKYQRELLIKLKPPN